MEATSPNPERLAVDSASDCALDTFIWPSYIRLKLSISTADLASSLASISTQLSDLCSALNSTLAVKEGEASLWPTPLTDDTSRFYFFVIGLPVLAASELGKVRQTLKEWQKEIAEKLKGEGDTRLEVKIISRKVFEESGFEVYTTSTSRQEAEVETELGEQSKKKERKDAFPAAGNFKKVKGSNPAEVRRQFLEHTINSSPSGSFTSTPEVNSNSASSGNRKLRPGKEVLKRLKFDEAYNLEDYVVGYIDRKEGILECSVAEWEIERGGERREELLAYVKERGSGVVVWDKVRKIDSVFGGKN